MKRTDGHVDLDLYDAVFNDIAAWDSNLRRELSVDYQRIVRTVATRGISFIMIDMPEAGKSLDFSLSRGRIDSSTLPETFGKVKDRGTREFLSCLFERIFDGMGYLRSDVDSNLIFFLRTVLYLSKKVKEDCSDTAIQAEVDSFLSVESSARRPTLDWECDTLNLELASSIRFTDGYISTPDLVSERDKVPKGLLVLLDEVCGIVFSQFPELDWREITPKHGSGAVADARTGTDKYLFRYWPEKLNGTFPYEYFAQHREDLHFEEDRSYTNHELPARLLAVPKTLKGPRLIASEPIAHQYLQQGLMRWIRQNLPPPLRACIDFKSQVPSRELCLEASKSGELATVDLSSASDRLTCWTVERALRTSPSLLRALHASRTRSVTNGTGVGSPFTIKLRKFAAQGSAVTFPVQSMVYACIAIACVLFERGVKARNLNSKVIKVTAKSLRIFGDDIIMPSYAVPSLYFLMDHLGLKVNVSKTHWKGLFRESCGMDAYGGEDVTPLYLRSLTLGRSPEDLVSWVDVINNAYSKGLWHLSDTMIQKIPAPLKKLIPVWNSDLGILSLRSFQSSVPMPKKSRHCRHLHRHETYGLSTVVRIDHRRRETSQNLLQFFVEDPSPDTYWRSGYLAGVRLQIRKRWAQLV